MGNATNYDFISNNAKGIQVSNKRSKLFEYLKQSKNFNDFLLFQETHSSLNDEKTNSCSVATEFGGKNSFDLIDQKSDENEQIIITEAKMNDNYFIVISIYNSNKGSEQSKTFSILQNMLNDIKISNKQIVLGVISL